MKSTVYVSVIGRPLTGKTTIMKKILDVLKTSDIEVSAEWGPDGPPRSEVPLDVQNKKLAAISRKSKVVLTEVQAERNYNPDTVGDIKVELRFNNGYQVHIVVLGKPFIAEFGDFSLSKERALAMANRIAMELDLDVKEVIPK